MNYLSSKFVSGNGQTVVVLDAGSRVGLAGFIHSNPGGKTASLQVGGANFHGKLGENITYANNGSSFARYTLSDHGLAVGDYVFTTTPSGIDGLQKVTAVTSTTFDTDMAYTGGGGSDATVYTGQLVFKVSSFTEYILEGLVGPFAAYEVIHHSSAGGDSNILWTYQ